MANFMSFGGIIGGGGIEEISTYEEMNATLEESNLLNAYQYIGDTNDLYTNGNIYVVKYKTLDECTWQEISNVAATGNAANYFSIGDMKGFEFETRTDVTSYLRLPTGVTYYVYIIGFNHNGSTGIDFGTFKKISLNTIHDICLTEGDRKYNYFDTYTKSLNMNHWGAYNYGGWKGCDLRYDILGSTDVAPSGYGYGSAVTAGRVGYDASATCATNPVANTVMSALPSDLRAVMKPMVVYTDNTGGGSDTASHVTSSIDYLPLPSAIEILGSSSISNSAENNYQSQYEYYAIGNSPKKYKSDNYVGQASWWCRSPNKSDDTNFTYIYTGCSSVQASKVLTIAPIFRV